MYNRLKSKAVFEQEIKRKEIFHAWYEFPHYEFYICCLKYYSIDLLYVQRILYIRNF